MEPKGVCGLDPPPVRSMAVNWKFRLVDNEQVKLDGGLLAMEFYFFQTSLKVKAVDILFLTRGLPSFHPSISVLLPITSHFLR